MQASYRQRGFKTPGQAVVFSESGCRDGPIVCPHQQRTSQLEDRRIQSQSNQRCMQPSHQLRSPVVHSTNRTGVDACLVGTFCFTVATDFEDRSSS